MKHPKLAVEKRTVLGKKVKTLRRDGLLPANVYGKGLSSVAVQLPLNKFDAIHKDVGEKAQKIFAFRVGKLDCF